MMIFKIAYTILAIINIGVQISNIGKPRKPITAGDAGFSFVIGSIIVLLVWVFL